MRPKRTDQSSKVKSAWWVRGWIFTFLGLIFSGAAFTQGPSADWRTLETDNFRLHFPAESKAWALQIGSRLESIRERVSQEVGYEPDIKADILIMDPLSRSNGSAIADLRRPRMVFWTTPPPPDSSLGNYRDWGEVLAVHEDTHLVHLLRPSRNPLQKGISKILPVGPIALKGPRWLIEGYATLIEGQLTGRGRPNSDLRTAILRRKAQLGELPSYERLDGDDTWHGYRMAYLLGSSYLEWLLEREGPDSLRNLWRRMSARQERDFDAAFYGVFGDTPKRLYNRFRAEWNYQALKAEAEWSQGEESGELWQDLSWNTGRPDLAPDGGRMVLVLRSRDQPSRLVIWPTDDEGANEERWQEAIDELVERDPLDVPAVRRRPFSKEPLHELVTRHGAAPYWPKFMPDGRSVLFVRFEPDRKGVVQPDLFRWFLEEQRVERLTHAAGVREIEPSHDGRYVFAVRHRNGTSQLVRIEMSSGRVEDMSEPSLKRIYAQPSAHPNGRHLAFVLHEQGVWRLVVRDLVTGAEARLPTPERAFLAHPAWSADGQTLFAAIGQQGRIDLRAYPFQGLDSMPTEATRLTQTLGAAMAPTPTPDGRSLFFLSLEADGLDLRRIDLSGAVFPEPPQALQVDLELPDPEPLTPEAIEETRIETYGLGRQERQPLLGGEYGPGGRSLLVGLRGGDLLGRLNYVVSAVDADGSFEGGSLTVRWLGSPLEWSGHLFLGEERPSNQPLEIPGRGEALDLFRKGLEVRSAWRAQTRRLSLTFEGGFALEERDSQAFPGLDLDRRLLFAEARQSSRHRWGSWTLRQNLSVNAQVGETGDHGWNLSGARLSLQGGYGGTRLGLAVAHRQVHGAQEDMDRLQLGGFRDAQIPDALEAHRLMAPNLPRAVAIGDESWFYRVDLRPFDLPLRFFYERHELERALQHVEIDLRGAELSWSLAPMPLFALPGVEFQIGVGEILDPPFEDEVEGWIQLSFHP